MKAEIITSGTELLLGEITDINTPYIAGQLAALGIDLYYTSAVGDNFERFSGVLRQAWGRRRVLSNIPRLSRCRLAAKVL